MAPQSRNAVPLARERGFCASTSDSVQLEEELQTRGAPSSRPSAPHCPPCRARAASPAPAAAEQRRPRRRALQVTPREPHGSPLGWFKVLTMLFGV